MDTLTIAHTWISLIALGVGIPVVVALLRAAPHATGTRLFLLLATITTVSGFFFPFNGMTPAFATGIVSSLVLIVTYAAQYVFHRAGKWRVVHALGVVISLYLLAFVTIAQSFLKIPDLHAYAPTGSEPPFAVAQLITLALFIWIGVRVARRMR